MFHFRSLNCIGYPCENVEHHSPIIRTHNLCWVLSNIDLHSIDNSIHKVQENKSVYEESKLKSDLSFRLYTAINRYLLLPWQNVGLNLERGQSLKLRTNSRVVRGRSKSLLQERID